VTKRLIELFVFVAVALWLADTQASAEIRPLGPSGPSITGLTGVQVGRSFELVVAAGSHQGQLQVAEASAWMPAHGHGLEQEPVVQVRSPSKTAVKGLIFQMGGDWVLTLRLRDGSSWYAVRIGITCTGRTCLVVDTKTEALAL